MKKISLNGTWRMIGAGYDCEGQIPGSVYSFLLDKGLMEDPFFRQNELEALKLLENEFTFIKTFRWESTREKVVLHCDGLDTLCDIYINGIHVAYTDNMHRTYEFDVTQLLTEGDNEVKIVCHPIDPTLRPKKRNTMFPQVPLPSLVFPTSARLIVCWAGTGAPAFPMQASGGILICTYWTVHGSLTSIFCSVTKRAASLSPLW